MEAAAGVPALAVVVPTRDRPRALAACLAALEAQTGPAFEVVVVDDGSVDAAAVEAVVATAPHARLVRGGGRGPAAARNLGAGEARAPVVCFTDDDCRPGPGWLGAVDRSVEAGAAAVAGPTRNGRPGNRYATASQAITNHLTESSYDPVAGTVRFAPTSNLAVRADLHRRLPFDESYPAAAGEDRDWCHRLAGVGVPLAYQPAAWVWHDQDLTLGGFWRQQVRYGRGAGRLPSRRVQRPRFYADLVRSGFAHGPLVGALVALAQLVVAAGVARERVGYGRSRGAPAIPDVSAPATAAAVAATSSRRG